MSPTTNTSTTAPKAKMTRTRSGVRNAGSSGSRRRDLDSTWTPSLMPPALSCLSRRRRRRTSAKQPATPAKPAWPPMRHRKRCRGPHVLRTAPASGASCRHPDEAADERAEDDRDDEEETLEGVLVERVDV